MENNKPVVEIVENEEEIKRKVSIELLGDDAVSYDILEKSLKLKQKSKRDKDEAVLQLAIECLEKVIDDCRKQSGTRYPSLEQVKVHLQN